MFQPCWAHGLRPVCPFWPQNLRIWKICTADIRFVFIAFLSVFTNKPFIWTITRNNNNNSMLFIHTSVISLNSAMFVIFVPRRSCSRSWSFWRCRRSTLRMSRRTWRRSSSTLRRRWRGSRASRWSSDSSWKPWTRTPPSWVPLQVQGFGLFLMLFHSIFLFFIVVYHPNTLVVLHVDCIKTNWFHFLPRYLVLSNSVTNIS